jgi:Spy/CpxP family protein refolding chaperone
MNTKSLFTLLAALLLAGAAQAQTKLALGHDPAVKTITRDMSNHMKLNEGQYVKLYSINRTRLSRQHEIERATATDAAARTAQLAELQAQYEQECARILTPFQLAQLQEQEPMQFAVGNGRG